MDRFDARKKVVADLEALDAVELIEAKTIQMPYGDRSGVVVEPWLTDQWYVNAGELAKPALAAVRDGKTQFVPKTWEKTYFNWMENIQPWCVSRQLWWGHQIPAWYAPDGRCFVAETEADAQAQAGNVRAHPRRRRARHLVLVRPCGPLPRSAGRKTPPIWPATTPAMCWSPASTSSSSGSPA